MPLIIDTYNVLHVTGVLPPELAVAEIDELASLIARSRFALDAVWLICDGVPKVSGRLGNSRIGRVVIEGAGHGRSADEHIAAFLKRDSAPRRMTVVTSDRAVARNAKARGADTLTSEDFLEMLAHDAGKSKRTKARATDPRRSVPLNDCEVSGWMRLFGITAEQAAIQSSAPLTTPSLRVASAAAPVRARRTPTNDAVLEQFLVATKDLADPLSILDLSDGKSFLEKLGRLDDATLDALMAKHEPTLEKDGERVGVRRQKKKRN